MNENNNDQNNEKYIVVRKAKTAKYKEKSAGSISISVAVIYVLTSLLPFILLVFVFSAAVDGSKNSSSFTTAILLILLGILIAGINILIKSKSKNSKELVKINTNDKNVCINCNNFFPIEEDECPNCHYKSNATIDCPDCGVMNNIHRTKCVGCNRTFNYHDKLYLLSGKQNSCIAKLIICCFFIYGFVFNYISDFDELKNASRVIIGAIIAFCILIAALNIRKFLIYKKEKEMINILKMRNNTPSNSNEQQEK